MSFTLENSGGRWLIVEVDTVTHSKIFTEQSIIPGFFTYLEKSVFFSFQSLKPTNLDRFL